MRSPIELELPVAATTPLVREAALERLGKAPRALADDALGEAPVFLVLRTGARADTGGWLGGGRVWVFALARELLLLAAGKFPYVERIPFAALRGSVYNAVTGELVLAPAPGARVRRLRVPPRSGYQVLSQIYFEEPRNAGASG